jgi:hypothetical protein
MTMTKITLENAHSQWIQQLKMTLRKEMSLLTHTMYYLIQDILFPI